MPSNELRELRLLKELPVGEMVDVVRQMHPKFDRYVQSKAENSELYGIQLCPDAMKELWMKFAPDEYQKRIRKAHKSGGHRLTCRIQARLETADYELLQQLIRADGYSTVQDWLADIVAEYIKQKGDIR